MSYRVGIAGYGIVGKRRHECINKIPDFEVKAICDRNILQESAKVDDIKYFSNYLDMLEEDLDVIIVCLTNDIASLVTIAGLKKGAHVFCEKPPGRTVQDILNVRIEEAKYPNLKLMYGFNHRYHESVQYALKILDTKELGNILSIRGVYGKAKLITFNQPDWRTKRDIAGGGVLLDQGIHMLDIMRLFCGEFIEVCSHISNSHWGYDVEDNAYALMKTGEGIVGMIHSSATQWRHRFNLDINLEKGSLILGGLLTGTKSYGAETLTIIKADPDNDRGDPWEQTIRYNKDPSWDNEMQVFTKCITQNLNINFGSSFDALKTMELVNNIYKSDKNWSNKFKIT
ncbi:Gfo/Idh/MocA family protein [Polynucleobacter bastaniensis]|uniref:Gfo/Idh/MocA family protein n=1 Tax=Polynucleobacter bastaniensis TaxID=2081039 RepID=UPI001C0C71D5|nr:Gfo/Idh/MocA family oxidoreductase [Polynucleobacter bastaniensis]MBU3598272.1 Gfo/Idh/MocA family oxidoreductase [Polynucleobacter bastaniensis]